ncbi:MAG: endonuclease III domain-containing protein [Planctomycetota bacterium]|jgi:endonuclease-3 related protein
MSTHQALNEIYQLLFDRFGPQHWWPGESQLEIMVGAILTQNTNWTNVEKAIANLKSAQLLIRPAGYFNVKAKRLKNFFDWLFDNYNGNIGEFEGVDTHTLRAELLSVKGIGQETADSILLYALEREVFVIDTYTARVTVRHGLIEPDADYSQLQDLFESNLPDDRQLFNEYHALLVRVGKEYCKPKARCPDCPLEEHPHSLETENY